MRLTRIVLTGLFALSTVVFGQDEQDLDKWMKQTKDLASSLRKNMESKAADAVAKDAKALEDIFKQVETFFAKRQTADAVKSSQDSHAAAHDLYAAATSGNADAMVTSSKALMGQCKTCHDAHREKTADGGYKLK
jgi:cytochrome c556